MEFKKKAKLATDGLWEDLFDGRIDVSKLLKDEGDVQRVQDAIKLLEQFKAEMEAKKILEYY